MKTVTCEFLRWYLYGIKPAMRYRDSKGRFLPNNPYRFRNTTVNIAGRAYRVQMQDQLLGTFFRALGGM